MQRVSLYEEEKKRSMPFIDLNYKHSKGSQSLWNTKPYNNSQVLAFKTFQDFHRETDRLSKN
jgi:hypothetical protein